MRSTMRSNMKNRPETKARAEQDKRIADCHERRVAINARIKAGEILTVTTFSGKYDVGGIDERAPANPWHEGT